MVTFKLQRVSGTGSSLKKNDRLKGDPRLLGILSFPDGNYLVATPQGYGSMKLQFLVPSVFLAYTRLAVVRSNYGFPVNKHDGITVFEYPNTATPVTQTFIDTNFGMGLVQGQWYYYTLFAKMPNSIPNWNQVDVDFAVCTRNYGSSNNLWRKIPGFYRQEDANTLQRQLTYTSGGQLRRFVDLLGYELDVMRTELDSLLDVNAPRDMASPLLSLQGYDLSLLDEGAIGDARFRALVDSAIGIRETKGTISGLLEYIRALTDYDARVLDSRNLMPTSMHARFQDPAGTTSPFQTGNTINPTIALQSTNLVGGLFNTAGFITGYNTWAAHSPSLTAPTGNGYDIVDWAFKIGVGLTGGGAIALTNISTNASGYNQATGAYNDNVFTTWRQYIFDNALIVPTTGITYTYSFVAVTQNAGNFSSMQVRFVWYDANGNYISNDVHAATGAPGSVSPAAPTLVSAVSNAAPSNAVYCDPQIYFASYTGAFASTVSGFRFEKTSTFTTQYVDPHTVEIKVLAQRVNLVQNPSAEVDNSFWTGTNMTSLVSAVNAVATAGGKVFQITCSASANPTMTTNTFMPINPAYIHSMRFDASVPNASIGANAIIQWYDNAATPNLIRTDTLNFPAPLPVNLMRSFVFGNVVPPSNAANAKVAIQFIGTANGNVILVDAALFGPGPPMTYFDGDTQDGLDTPSSVTPTQFSDFQWGGAQGKSTSYYYNNFYIAMARLRADAVNWMPTSGLASFTTLVAP